jgi:cell division protein FtsW
MGLASGGFLGVGLGASRQKWANLSEANTDFIFSVIGEELGLLGTLIVLLMYAALIYGIFRTALHTKDIFYKYACAGIGAWFLLQVTVNVGSDIGLLPVVGVSLPFISYGGSALLADFIGVGFVLSVIRRDPEVRAALRAKRQSQAE